jgi:hypothetical protein
MGLPPQWSPNGASEGDGIDWSAEPRDGLRAALRERDAYERDRDRAAVVSRNATKMVAALEIQLKQFDGLGAQIDAFTLEQARAGTDEELPYALSSAAQERSRVLDRLDRGIKANQTLQAELRDSQRQLEQAQRICHLWCQRIMVMQAEKVAAELFAAQANADALRDDLNAFAYTVFPGTGGPVELTATLHRALNTQPKPREEDHAKIQPLKEPWLRAFSALLTDPYADLLPTGDTEEVAF